MADKIQKSIEFKAAKAAGEISDPLSAKAEGKHHIQEFVFAERHAALF